MSDAENRTASDAATPGADEHNWYSNDTATFGDRLADAREHVGMSQEDLARRLGVKLKTLTAWENDMAEPRANKLSMLSGLLNVSLRWLMTGEGDGLPHPDDARTMPEDVNKILTELRQTQSDLVRMADRVGRLEKRLKTAWSAPR
ncbi:helix-turn-helix domain-containing protein [Oceaniglobus roseus]|uniref:helix-turn-helix domain-containing protein n=1 Tax=Oceaniglobus roseus TaxID=1737570 RepID=UPI000C7F7708|nr:helix-turn-helix transcriptional regulator [Kandeliimicrobium roseum]